MNVNNMTPEVQNVINRLLDADHIDGCIVHLENAAHALQTIEREAIADACRREIAAGREELEQLLGYHPDRE